jgi:hypothetical protein
LTYCSLLSLEKVIYAEVSPQQKAHCLTSEELEFEIQNYEALFHPLKSNNLIAVELILWNLNCYPEMKLLIQVYGQSSLELRYHCLISKGWMLWNWLSYWKMKNVLELSEWLAQPMK